MSFRSMVSSTIISIAAITIGGVLTVIGIVREIRPLAIGGIVLALSLIHISEPTRLHSLSRMPSSA